MLRSCFLVAAVIARARPDVAAADLESCSTEDWRAAQAKKLREQINAAGGAPKRVEDLFPYLLDPRFLDCDADFESADNLAQRIAAAGLMFGQQHPQLVVEMVDTAITDLQRQEPDKVDRLRRQLKDEPETFVSFDAFEEYSLAVVAKWKAREGSPPSADALVGCPNRRKRLWE